MESSTSPYSYHSASPQPNACFPFNHPTKAIFSNHFHHTFNQMLKISLPLLLWGVRPTYQKKEATLTSINLKSHSSSSHSQYPKTHTISFLLPPLTSFLRLNLSKFLNQINNFINYPKHILTLVKGKMEWMEEFLALRLHPLPFSLSFSTPSLSLSVFLISLQLHHLDEEGKLLTFFPF